MAKKNYKEEYDLVSFELEIVGKPKIEQTLAIIKAAANVQEQICHCSDKIKIENLNTINDLMDIKLTKGEFSSIITNMRDIEKKGNDEKFLEKLNENCRKHNVLASMHTMLAETAEKENFNGISFPKHAALDFDTEDNSTFMDILKDSVSNKANITEFLNKQYKTYGQAFQHLWEYKFTAPDFHKLVDDYYYYEGGYPSDTTPPKTWTAIKGFQQLVKMYHTIGFDGYMNEYLRLFGLKVEVIDEEIVREYDGCHPAQLGSSSTHTDATIAVSAPVATPVSEPETDETEEVVTENVVEENIYQKLVEERHAIAREAAAAAEKLKDTKPKFRIGKPETWDEYADRIERLTGTRPPKPDDLEEEVESSVQSEEDTDEDVGPFGN